MEPYEGREPYIFVSYARKDKERVLPYLDALSGAGYRVWYDKGIKAGEHWTETLVEKVEACAVFCPLFSEAFNASRFCFEETEYAYRKDKPIVPVYLEELKLDDLRPLYRLLGSRQDLRLYQFEDAAQFAERLEGQQVFVPCKAAEWHKVGEIQWRFVDGVLEITKREGMAWFPASIPSYQFEFYGGSTAPWMPHREKIRYVEIENIKTIGDYAFCGCHNLMYVSMQNSATELKIGRYAFDGCTSLTNVRIPDGVTKIDEWAFHNCTSLTDVRIPDSVTEIDSEAFTGCENLKSIEIPAGAEVSLWAFPEHTLVIRRPAP